MNDTADKQSKQPDKIVAIKESSFVTWPIATDLSPQFMQHFHDFLIPVVGIRHVPRGLARRDARTSARADYSRHPRAFKNARADG